MQFAPPDPSLGVFETMLVRDQRVQALDAHLERLRDSVSDLYGLEPPTGLRDTVRRLAASDEGARRLRIDAVPTGSELRIELTRSPLRAAPAAAVTCNPVVVAAGLGPHKWADRRLIDSLAADGRVPLLVDADGDLLEAAVANVWLIEDGELVTPPTDGRILPGVTRAMLLELAPRPAREEPISLARARSAQTMFLTSALRHAVPASFDDQSTPGGELAAIRDALSTYAWD